MTLNLTSQDFANAPAVGDPITIAGKVTAVDQDGSVTVEAEPAQSAETPPSRTAKTADQALEEFMANQNKETDNIATQ